MWKRAYSRIQQHIQHHCKLLHRFREQARSHNGSVANTNHATAQDPLWERACSRWRHPIQQRC
ncbi:hypothetical protein C0J56_18635 [Pseudomonas fluorescens]|nr:hypothetical protein C0J56_18635 [Pseudomonas fluorescens]